MRAVVLAISLTLACGHEAPPPAAPKGPSPCARAADRMVHTMLERVAAKDAASQDAPPTEAADAMRNLIRERCEQDAWSAQAVDCLIKMTSQDDAAACAAAMTEAQQAALVRDEQARFGAGAAAHPGAGSAQP